jgi:hypothetical protein
VIAIEPLALVAIHKKYAAIPLLLKTTGLGFCIAPPLHVQLAAREFQFRPAVATIDDQRPVRDHPRAGLLGGIVFLAAEKLRRVLAVEEDDRVGRRITELGTGCHHGRCRAGDYREPSIESPG